MIDVTQYYGLLEVPDLSNINYKVVDYTKRFEIKDLSELSIWKRIEKFKKENILSTLDYLSSKLGYNTSDPNSFS